MFAYYLKANLLVAVVSVFVWCLKRLVETRWVQTRFRDLLKGARFFLGLAVVLPLVVHSQRPFLKPSAQIWSGGNSGIFQTPASVIPAVSIGTAVQTVPLDTLHWVFGALALLAFIVATSRFAIAAGILVRLQRHSTRARKIGRVEVRVSERIQIPFSFWAGRAFIYLPHYLLLDSKNALLAVRHESQHHRQGDTLWAYGLEFFRGFFACNPFYHLLVGTLSELQEFACDEALVDRKSVSAHAYGGCLLWVAETARGAQSQLVGTTCLAMRTSGPFLKRRILMLLENKHSAKRVYSVGMVLAFSLILGAAWAADDLVQDRRVAMADAQSWAAKARQNSNFPIVMNDSVLGWLNHFLGTPDGRRFVKRALEGREKYRSLIESKLAEYGLPGELAALPITESGYKNLPESKHPMHSAGLWQFIPQTARNFQLRVEGSIDERMDVAKSTDAACQYLKKLREQFQSWELAVMAYNAGENKIQAGVDSTHSRDAWTLIDKGIEGDPGYLPKMVASVLILKNPTIVD